MSARVRMEEIAQHIGVSVATVSLVLRDKPGITDETRQRVIEAARKLGYRKLPQTDLISPKHLKMVGMLNKTRGEDEPHTNQFYGPIIAGIDAACRQRQINLLYATVPVDEDNHPLEVPRMLMNDELDGLLLVGTFVNSTIMRLMENRTVAAILIDAYAPGHNYDAVLTDNFHGAYEAVSYLVKCGHHHIGLVGSLPEAYPSILERRRGYLQALQDFGINQPYFADGHILSKEAVEVTLELLRQQPQITALFCCNDWIATRVIQAVPSIGRQVPKDLSIIGFDNIEMASHTIPGLTTMNVDKISMGRRAVDLLASRSEFPDSASVSVILRPTLVVRESVQKISSG